MLITGKVIALMLSSLVEEYQKGERQFYYCEGGNDSRASLIGRSVFTISLYNGEKVLWYRNDVIGVLEPELLPNWAKLRFSQVKPHPNTNEQKYMSKYRGYSFLESGKEYKFVQKG